MKTCSWQPSGSPASKQEVQQSYWVICRDYLSFEMVLRCKIISVYHRKTLLFCRLNFGDYCVQYAMQSSLLLVCFSKCIRHLSQYSPDSWNYKDLNLLWYVYSLYYHLFLVFIKIWEFLGVPIASRYAGV